MYPLLLRPTVSTLRNRWKRRSERQQEFFRGSVLALLTLAVIAGAYFGGLWVLSYTKTQIDFAYFHSSMLLGLILFFLMSLLLLTNTIAAASSLFMAKDLDLFISAPISCWRFFWSKYFEVVVGSSWMTAIFLSPVLAVFGSFYHGGWGFMAMTVVVLLPYFLIPAALAMLCASLSAVLVPMNRKRELLALVLIAGFSGLYVLGRAVAFGFEDNARIDLVDLLKLVSMLSFANREWIPTYWAAVVLGEYLEPRRLSILPYLVLLYSATIASISLAFLAFRLLHFSGYSRQGLGAQGRRINSQASHYRFRRALAKLAPSTRALVVKEWKSATRDFSQSVNVLLLFGLFGLYLYMLTFQHLFQQMFPADEQRKWKFFLLITNICLEAFVITAMGTRLVFPSISRESRAYWVLQTSSLRVEQLLRVKFAFWCILVYLITTLFFGFAAYLSYGSLTLIIAKSALNALLCTAIVGLGIGLGAFFANFEWEHPSQLTTGFGSLVFMLVGVTLIAITLILTATAIWFGVALPKMGFFSWRAGAIAAVAALLVPVLCLGAAHSAIRLGARELISRQER